MKEQTQEGREAWWFICQTVRPMLPPVTSIKHIKSVAYAAYKCGADWPASRIDEAAAQRCGPLTLHRIKARARELGLAPPEASPWYRPDETGGRISEREIIRRLEWMRLHATGATAQAIDAALAISRADRPMGGQDPE